MNISGPGDRVQHHLNRRQLLFGAITAATGAATDVTTGEAWGGFGHLERSCCPVRLGTTPTGRMPTLADAITGNARAIAVASASGLISRAKANLYALAQDIGDGEMRWQTLSLLDNPAPTYQLRSPTEGDRQQVRQDLLAAGLIPESTTLEGMFPPVADASQAAQPTWSAPGGGYGGHHAYPGGLVVHEWVNAAMSKAYSGVYDDAYGIVSMTAAVDMSVLLAAPLWHDIHKTVVMQWNPDGSEFPEQIIADTGAHHPLSGAEAIVRGMSSDFVVALLSAHNAATSVMETVSSALPILSGYQRLVNYVRAAAIIVCVDAVTRGLLRQDSAGNWLLRQDPPRFEGFVNHLADQDYILTGDTSAAMVQSLRESRVSGALML